MRLTIYNIVLLFLLGAVQAKWFGTKRSPTEQLADTLKNHRGIIEVDDNNFESVVFQKGKYSLVNFYSPSCIHCSALEPEFEPLGELFNNSKIQVIRINGLHNKRIRKLHQLISFPALRLFAPDGTLMADYPGHRTTELLSRFVTDNTGVQPKLPQSRVVSLNDDSFEEFMEKNKKKNVLVTFVAPWLDEWANRYHFYETIADSQPEGFILAKVDATASESAGIISRYRVSRYPTLIEFPAEGSSRSHQIQVVQSKSLGPEHIEALLNHEDIGVWMTYQELVDIVGDDSKEDNSHKYFTSGFNPKHSGKETVKMSEEEEDDWFEQFKEL